MNELPKFLWETRFHWLAGYFALVAVEMIWRAARLRQIDPPGLIVTNPAMWLAELALRSLAFGLRLAPFAWISSRISWHLPASLPVAVLGYLLVDFIYYWKHRALHGTRLGWAVHAVHHSSEHMNLLAAIRLGWFQRLVDDFFFLPLAFLGFDPVQLLFLILLNEMSPFWCHTEAVGRLGWIDGILNTPHNHRIHHAAAKRLADANFGATLIVWDRIFGTWRHGEEPGRYGVEGWTSGLNPLRIQIGTVWRAWKQSDEGGPEQRHEESGTQPGAAGPQAEAEQPRRRPDQVGHEGGPPAG